MLVRVALTCSIAAVLLVAFTAAPSPAIAQGDEPALGDPKPDPMDIRVREALDKGLKHLASIQNHDGSWSNNVGNKLGHGYIVNRDGHNRSHLGVTAIVCMAFMASGHTPDRGEFSRHVSAGLNFIISTIDPESGWMSRHQTRMYSHAFATMLLAEVYGQTRDPVVLRHLRNATKFIVDSQNQQGAWRYVPDQQDSDMSVTVCQLQALRAAANVGVVMPGRTPLSARRCTCASSYIHPARAAQRRGGFRYQLDWDDRSTFTLTAAGVVALQSMPASTTATPTRARSRARPRQITIDLNRSIDF
jgi:hypothetical protein